MLWRYTVEGNQLKPYLADNRAMNRLARDGKLTRQNGLVTAESLSAYLDKHGPEGLFRGEDDAAISRKQSTVGPSEETATELRSIER
jgi:hypothetical protein